MLSYTYGDMSEGREGEAKTYNVPFDGCNRLYGCGSKLWPRRRHGGRMMIYVSRQRTLWWSSLYASSKWYVVWVDPWPTMGSRGRWQLQIFKGDLGANTLWGLWNILLWWEAYKAHSGIALLLNHHPWRAKLPHYCHTLPPLWLLRRWRRIHSSFLLFLSHCSQTPTLIMAARCSIGGGEQGVGSEENDRRLIF